MQAERANLVHAIATEGHVPDLVSALQTRDSRSQELEREFSMIRPHRAVAAAELGRVRREVTDRARAWRTLLEGVDEARPLVSSLLVGRVTFTPLTKRRSWDLRGEGSVAGLFQKIVSAGMASPICASWNQLRGWLRTVDGLRRAA